MKTPTTKNYFNESFKYYSFGDLLALRTYAKECMDYWAKEGDSRARYLDVSRLYDDAERELAARTDALIRNDDDSDTTE